jgi:hypothetical protein
MFINTAGKKMTVKISAVIKEFSDWLCKLRQGRERPKELEKEHWQNRAKSLFHFVKITRGIGFKGSNSGAGKPKNKFEIRG